MFAITCASCNRPLRVPQAVLGQTVQCPLCLDEFVARADPAAEAAARAAEPPARRAARPERVAAQVAAEEESVVVEAEEDVPVWGEPVAEAAPTKTAGRKTAEGRTLAFPVLVTRDPDRVLRGRMDGELTDRGLHLRKPRQPPAFAAGGAKARYLGANRLVVTVEGREVELVIDKRWTSTYHLARDVAGFLNGQRGFPEGRAYAVPWYLYVLPALVVALPFAAIPFGLLTDGCLGGFVWCVIAAVLAGVGALVVAQPRLTPRARLIGAGGLLGLGAAVYLISIPLTPAYTVDPAKWRTYAPAGEDFSVLMPGAAGVVPDGTGDDARDYMYMMANPDLSFWIHVAPAPPLADNPFAFQAVNGVNYQAVNEIKKRIQNAYTYPSTLVIQSERDAGQSGLPYHEIVYQATLGHNDVGMAPTETVVARVYVANGKIYALTMRGPRVRSDGPDVLKFLNSFRVKTPANPKPAPPPVRQPASPVGMNGLLAYWSFDQAQNNQVLVDDESGNLLTGTLHNATIIRDGPRGQAVHFNGRGSDFDFSDANNLDFPAGGDFTLCGWVRTRVAQGVLVSMRQDADAAPDIDVRIDGGGALSVDVRQDGQGRNAEANVGGPVVNDGAWHHFALSRRCVFKTTTLSLYVDGTKSVVQLALNASGPITTDLHALGAELYWQRHGFGGNADFTGDMDEFCVFGRALDDGEIRELAGVGGP